MAIIWCFKNIGDNMIPGIVASQITAEKTVNPTINTPFYTTSWRYTVKNNDALTATIYADYNVNPPTTNRGSIASGANTATINTGLTVGGFTIYARAQASGKDPSDVVSYYQS